MPLWSDRHWEVTRGSGPDWPGSRLPVRVPDTGSGAARTVRDGTGPLPRTEVIPSAGHDASEPNRRRHRSTPGRKGHRVTEVVRRCPMTPAELGVTTTRREDGFISDSAPCRPRP